MRPELLKFSGLRSYHGTAEVDFTDLGLFAIIGDTGSGKSTIIEALSLALYARPTWSGHIDGLVSDAATAWQVELTFAAGSRRWRVTRRRGRGASIDKLEELDGSGEKVDGKAAVNARVIEIIGLDHNQFTSAVVLPQGQFEKLLVAGETDRTKLLTSILGLDDIEATQRQAKQLLDEWSPKAETWSALRDRLGPDPAAKVKEVAARAAETETRAAALATAAQRCSELEPQLRDATAAHDTLAGRLDALSEMPAQFADELTATQQRWAEAEAAVAAADVELERVGEQAAHLERARTQHLGGFATRDHLVEALGTARRVAEQLPARLDAVAAARDNLAAVEQHTPQGALDAELVAAVDRTAGEVSAAEQQLRAAEEAQRGGIDAWRRASERRARLVELEAQLPEATASIEAAREAVEEAQGELVAAEQAEQAAAASVRAALVGTAADQAGADCAPGDDCPVCARPLPDDYTPPEHQADVQAAQDAERAARAAVAQARTRAAELIRALDLAAATGDRLHADIDTAKRDARDADTAAEAAGVDPSASDSDAALASLAAAVAAAEQSLTAARAAAADAVGARDAAQAALDRAAHEHKARVAAATTEVQHTARAAADLVAELDQLDVDADGHTDPGARAAAVLQQLERARATLEELDGQLAALDAERQALTERRGAAVASGGDARDAARDLFVQLRGRCDAVDQLHAAATVAAPDASLPSPPAHPRSVSSADELSDVLVGLDGLLGALDAVVAAATQTLSSSAERRATLDAELVALLGDAGVATAAELHAAAGAARSEEAEVRQTLERHRKDAAEAAAYDERLATLRPFVANLRVLHEALRNNRFVAHLVAARETELLAEASQRLSEITGGRFGFGAGFKVINRYSGEQRRSDALSGGERFQAALALALALMEIASRGTRGRLEAVFIDEGFGSLDGASLEQALDRLRSVSGDGTTVALVSHLRAVAEHVNDVLHVTRDDTTGSQVAKLDADELERMLDDDARSGLTA